MRMRGFPQVIRAHAMIAADVLGQACVFGQPDLGSFRSQTQGGESVEEGEKCERQPFHGTGIFYGRNFAEVTFVKFCSTEINFVCRSGRKSGLRR